MRKEYNILKVKLEDIDLKNNLISKIISEQIKLNTRDEEIKILGELIKHQQTELELYKGSLHKEHEAIHRANDLEDNWNELKRWLEDENNQKYSQYIYNYSINNWVLNKMQELEGVSNE